MVGLNPATRRSGPPPRSLRERILSSVKIDENSCWRWQKYVKPNGYGQIGVPGQSSQYVHRVAYLTFVGPIPDGLQIDHLCRVRDCCNPDHLEPVKARTNVLRGVGFAAEHARVERCPAGHPYDNVNTYVRADRQGRGCRTCRLESSQRSQSRRAEQFRRSPEVPVDKRTPVGGNGKTHCPSGHPYAGANLYVDTHGRRQCRTCRRAAQVRATKRRSGLAV
ncbi:HNH endonuclease signature motif containing protein [Micromonospora sp. NPDC005174]|uniref:HNH endonuclease signature motif containing protein n=1 Tax=Micromonospora sp. NPDC005174 TaxID=3157018 RepID=UPI0033BBDADB